MRILLFLFLMFIIPSAFAQVATQVEFDAVNNIIAETKTQPPEITGYDLDYCIYVADRKNQRLNNLKSEMLAVQQEFEAQDKICKDAKLAGLKTKEELGLPIGPSK